MEFKFYKYHGTFNDFVMIDNRSGVADKLSEKDIAFICDRRQGIGADGLILLQEHTIYDFKMIYFNADGHVGSMCGNGGRCIVAFAHFLGMADKQASFEAVDGGHSATVLPNGQIALMMNPVDEIHRHENDFVLDTGSPHYVQFRDDVDELDVYEMGSWIRNSLRFKEKGINVNFVTATLNGLNVRTFERGVEDETWSCGTGVVASAISFAHKNNLKGHQEIKISTKGGDLSVQFDMDNGFENIRLIGPAVCVYTGKIDI